MDHLHLVLIQLQWFQGCYSSFFKYCSEMGLSIALQSVSDPSFGRFSLNVMMALSTFSNKQIFSILILTPDYSMSVLNRSLLHYNFFQVTRNVFKVQPVLGTSDLPSQRLLQFLHYKVIKILLLQLDRCLVNWMS